MKPEILQLCKIHGLTAFTTRINESNQCKRCNQFAVNKRRRLLKVKAVEYKGGKCERCGYSKCIMALEFHHTDPTQKDFGVSTSGSTRSWEKIKKEIDKCILVCSNCHREIHEELRDCSSDG